MELGGVSYLLYSLTAVLLFSLSVNTLDVATNHWYVTLKEPLAVGQVRDLVKRSGFSVVNQVC